MGDSTEECQANSDRELWRAVRGDYYAPSVFVTSEGGIGMNHGGTVFVLTVEEWIKRAESFIRDDQGETMSKLTGIEDAIDAYRQAVDQLVRAEIDACNCQTNRDWQHMHTRQDEEAAAREKLLEFIVGVLTQRASKEKANAVRVDGHPTGE